MKWSIRAVLLAGLVIRLLIAPFTAHPADILIWYDWVQGFLRGNFVGLFVPPYLMSYVLVPFALVYGALQNVLHEVPISINSIPPILRPAPIWNVTLVPGLLFDLIAKLPFIIADTTAAWILYNIVMSDSGNQTQATRAAALWFINPITIWVSSGWGMFDSIPTAFVLLALYFALKRNAAMSGLCAMVAFALKLFPVVIFIPLLIYFRRKGTGLSEWWRGATGLLIGAGGLATIFFIPYWNNLLEFVSQFLSTPTFPIPVVGARGYGLTYWSWSLVWPISTLGILLSFTLGAALLLIVYTKFLRTKGDLTFTKLIAVSLSSVLAIFLSFRLVAENYVVWIIPMMAILLAYDRIEGSLFWGTSLLAFIFSITNSLLPFYLLPISPWIGADLETVLGWVAPYRIMPSGTLESGVSFGTVAVAIMGTVFSAFMVLVLLETLFLPRRKLVQGLVSMCSRILTHRA